MAPRTRNARGNWGGPLKSNARDLLREQREANTSLLVEALRIQEAADVAESHNARVEVALEKAMANEEALLETAEFRERLLAIIGHDLRNPLSAILVAASVLLARASLGEDDRRTVSRIVRSGERMSRIISTLVEFTRVRLGGDAPLETHSADLAAVCQDVIDELATTSPVDVRFRFEGDLVGTWDMDRIAQAVSNLASNAIEHATPGTTVRVDAHREESSVVLEVKNQGVPISPELLPVVFLPFRGGRGDGAPKAGHLGLGLYIAHQAVLAHGGTLVATCADRVTSFVMRLPVAVSSSTPLAPTLLAPARPQPIPAEGD